MLAEVIRRHFGGETSELPDLLVIDGGPGQLAAAVKALEEIGLAGRLPVMALAKSAVLSGGRAVRDRLFLPGRKNPKFLPQSAPGWLLLLRLRDEAHRFAITYHRAAVARKPSNPSSARFRAWAPSAAVCCCNISRIWRP